MGTKGKLWDSPKLSKRFQESSDKRHGITVAGVIDALVSIPAEQHVHLHANVYYMYINAGFLLASRTGGERLF